MKNEIIKFDVQELNLLEPSKAEKIKQTFLPMTEMLSGFESVYNEIMTESKAGITAELCNRAKRARIDVGKVRIETGKIKDKQKEYIKLEDKAIMGVHNILVWAVKEKEDNLQGIENFFEIQEQKRLQELQSERVQQIEMYIDDASERDLSAMDEDVWAAYYNTKKQAYEDIIEAEKQAEIDRIEREKEEAEERERIRLENEKLKKEAEQKEQARLKEEKARKAKEEAERKSREEQQRIEREKHEAAIKAEREKAAKIEREEREKREALQAQIKAKEDAERKAREQEEARLQSELAKGDAEKVQDLQKDLENLKQKYQFKSAKNKKMHADVCVLIDKVILFINK